MSKNVIFIGFMNCGKSTIARALAESLGLKFMDTDEIIKQRLGKEISEIFAEFGEDFFRNEEKKLALEFRELKGVIIATGGGFYKALQRDKNSVIIYLKASFEFLEKRLENEPCQKLDKKALCKRPLFANKEKARLLYKERLKEYENLATFTINVEGKSVEMIVDEALKELKCGF